MSQITQILERCTLNTEQFEKVTLDYHPQLAHQLFERIHEKAWSMLLSSATAEHPDSRYDIIVCDPLATVTSVNGVTTVSCQELSDSNFDNAFAALQLLEQNLSDLSLLEPQLPFCGGLLGLLGYDLGKQIETLPTTAEADISLPDLAVGLYNWAVVIDHEIKCAFAVGIDAKSQYSKLTALSGKTTQLFRLTAKWQSNMSKQDYFDKFAQVKEYIFAGDCYQINLAQRFEVPYQGCEWQAYKTLEQVNKGPFSAFLRLEQGAVLSVSPERFISLDGKKMQTKPIKGTRPKLHDIDADKAQIEALANAEKDQAENLMIVDLLRNDFGRVAKPGSVKVPKLFDVETFPAVHHLVSTVEATLQDETSASELLKACFPGGSITGAPKIRAMEIIEELEPHARNAYCGSIGYISANGKMDTSITIRTLVAEQGKLYAWAGGGLVADSEVEAEYQETFDKLAKILPTLSG